MHSRITCGLKSWVTYYHKMFDSSYLAKKFIIKYGRSEKEIKVNVVSKDLRLCYIDMRLNGFYTIKIRKKSEAALTRLFRHIK